MSQPTLKLVQFLIGKSIVESLLVGALAIGFFVTAFPPYFRGWSEVADQRVSGWAVNSAAPQERVVVQLFIDGNFVANGIANEFRPDVRYAGWADDDFHGYNFTLDPLTPGHHEARVYALHKQGDGANQTLQMLGEPLHFWTDEAGRAMRIGRLK